MDTLDAELLDRLEDDIEELPVANEVDERLDEYMDVELDALLIGTLETELCELVDALEFDIELDDGIEE